MLFIVPTPIGNLEDITLRALRVLKEVDLVLAEDTRTSRKLLQHYDISTSMKSFHIHNEHREVNRIIEWLEEGQNIALISDAGMPGISDPGYLLIRASSEKNLDFTVLPGPNAVIPAILLSAFPCSEFSFLGFLPPKKGRQKKLKIWAERREMLVIYESPHRILKLSKELFLYFPQRKVALVREITKIHEEVWRGSTEAFENYLLENKPKGEMVVIISPIK